MLAQIAMSIIPWGAIVPAVASMAIASLVPIIYRVLHINASTKARADMQTALKNALTFGIAKLHATGVNPADIPTNDALIQSLLQCGRDYLDENAQGIMKHLGVSDNALAMAMQSQVLNAVDNYTISNGRIQQIATPPPAETPAAGIVAKAEPVASDTEAKGYQG